jgi:hypothetical protein
MSHPNLPSFLCANHWFRAEIFWSSMKDVWLLRACYFHCKMFNSGKSPHSEFLASHYLHSNWGRLDVVATTTKSGGWGNYFKQLLNLPESLTSSETSARLRHCILRVDSLVFLLQDCWDNTQCQLRAQNVLVSFWDYFANVPLLDSELLFLCVVLRRCQWLDCTVLNGRTHGWIRKGYRHLPEGADVNHKIRQSS